MTYALRTDNNKSACIQEINSLLVCDPPQYEVEIKKFAKSKTSQQRKYFHKILQLICDYTGDYQEDLKMEIKYRVLPLREITVGGRQHLYPISSEKTNTKQYSELIEAALMCASAAEVHIPNPGYYGLAMGER